MADKKRKKPRGDKPHGHYCRVCGEHKANEKFSGKGHAAHICKVCAALPVGERNEMLTLRKIEGMAFRHLSEAEIKWLRGKINDQRPDVAKAAREAHGMKFPRYERGQRKKGLTAFSLEFFIHGEIWDEYGDEIPVHALITLDSTGLFRHTDYNAPVSGQVTEYTADKHEARRFLKSVIHELDALFWDEDLSDAEYDEDGCDPYLDILPEFRPDYDDCDPDEDDDDGSDLNDGDSDAIYDADTAPADGLAGVGGSPDITANPHTDDRESIWSLRLELNNGKDKVLKFYNRMHDAPRELYLSLMEWFMPFSGDMGDDLDDDAPLE